MGYDFDRMMYGWDGTVIPVDTTTPDRNVKHGFSLHEASTDNTVKYGGRTKVEIEPAMKNVAGYEMQHDPVRERNRPSHTDFPQQPSAHNPAQTKRPDFGQEEHPGFTNPIDRIRQMYTDSIAGQTKRAQKLARGK